VSENEKLLAQKENLLVPDDWTTIFSSPASAVYSTLGFIEIFGSKDDGGKFSVQC